jgi:hypothetical protein
VANRPASAAVPVSAPARESAAQLTPRGQRCPCSFPAEDLVVALALHRIPLRHFASSPLDPIARVALARVRRAGGTPLNGVKEVVTRRFRGGFRGGCQAPQMCDTVRLAFSPDSAMRQKEKPADRRSG